MIAYGKLDEAEGTVAADSVSGKDGTMVGSPLWQPTGGQRAGAVQLDGADDYVRTTFVMNASAGPFSVFAWVKGGAPGQTALSQVGGVNWFMVAPHGGLATELRQAGRLGKPLTSTAIIDDGAWHHVGLVWDGANRTLYVDDIEVAKDAQSSLAASGGGLYIGAGSTLAPGTFWSGLIDDVRIYNRAVKP